MTPANSLSPSSSLSEKIDWLAERHWRFGREDRFEELLTDIFNVDDSGAITSDPKRDPLINETSGIMLLAGSGNGKSTLLGRTLERATVLDERTKKSPTGNTLKITVPPSATVKSIAEKIAELTGYEEIDPKAKVDEAWSIARHRMRKFGIKLLVIDEAHHLLRTGPGRDIPGAVQALKHLLQGDGSVAVILSGVPKLREIILQDPETDGRYFKFELDMIEAGSQDAERLSRCIAKSAKELGLFLDPDDKLSERLIFAEHGRVGRTIRLAKETMRQALIKGRDNLRLEDAEASFAKRYGSRSMSPFSPSAWNVVQADLEAAGWVQ